MFWHTHQSGIRFGQFSLSVLVLLGCLAHSWHQCRALHVDGSGGVLRGGETTPVTRLAFGSCANQSAPQPIWDAILKFDPELFIWLGDNIYSDRKAHNHFFGPGANVGPFANVSRFEHVSPEEMKLQYEEALRQPGYSKLRERAKVLGTWDDHDYGLDNAGKELPIKREAMQLMLDFLGEPKDSPRRKQDGVYASYTQGPPGKRLKVILLDTRFNRDPHLSDGTMLGEAQWAWLEGELRTSDAQIHIIGSSIQVVSNLTALVQPLFDVEGWPRFPSETQRLYDLLAAVKVPGVIFISGDVHFSELSRYDCSGTKYPLYDLTSSGLTQSTELASGFPLDFLQRLAGLVIPKPMRVLGQPGIYGCEYRSCAYGKPNFGLFQINWDASPPTIDLQSRDIKGRVVLGRRIYLSDLQPGVLSKAPTSRGFAHQKFCTREADLPWFERYQIAMFFSTLFFVVLATPVGLLLVLSRILMCARGAKRKLE